MQITFAMVVYSATLSAFVPDVPYLHIVRLAGLGSIIPRTTINAETECKPRPVPFEPPLTLRLYLPRSIIKPRSISPQMRLNAAICTREATPVHTQQKRMQTYCTRFAFLYVTVTNIHRYPFPILLLAADYLSKTQLT